MDEFQKYRDVLIEQCKLHSEVLSGPDVKLTRYFFKRDILEPFLDAVAHGPEIWKNRPLRDWINSFDAFKAELRREVKRKRDPYMTKLSIILDGEFGHIVSVIMKKMLEIIIASPK